MNKLEEYKLKKVTNDLGFGSVNPEFTPVEIQAYRETLKYYWKTGFDAAIALDLPVKFMEYSANLISTRKDGHILHLLPEISKQDRWYTEKELYQYWIENVYKSE